MKVPRWPRPSRQGGTRPPRRVAKNNCACPTIFNIVPQRSRSTFSKALVISVLIGLASLRSNAITLDAVLTATVQNNPAISQAKSALEQAAGARLILRSSGLPTGRLQGLAGVQGGKRAGEPDTQPFGILRGFANQPLFNAAIPPSFRKADVEVLIAQQRLNMAVVEQLHAA